MILPIVFYILPAFYVEEVYLDLYIISWFIQKQFLKQFPGL